MERIERELFVRTAVGVCFQLGFSSLLLAAAKARGEEAARWLTDFEERVGGDIRRMKVTGDVPEALVAETTEAILGEFRHVFDSVREEVLGEARPRLEEKQRRTSPLEDPRIHLCGH